MTLPSLCADFFSPLDKCQKTAVDSLTALDKHSKTTVVSLIALKEYKFGALKHILHEFCKAKLVSKSLICDAGTQALRHKYLETVVDAFPAINKYPKTVVDSLPALKKYLETTVDAFPTLDKYPKTVVDSLPALKKCQKTTVDGFPAFKEHTKTAVDALSATTEYKFAIQEDVICENVCLHDGQAFSLSSPKGLRRYIITQKIKRRISV